MELNAHFSNVNDLMIQFPQEKKDAILKGRTHLTHRYALHQTQTKAKRKKSNEFTSLPKRPSLNRKAMAHIVQLLDCVPPARLKKELLYIFLIFLEHEHDTLPLNFRQMVTDYYMLFHFLDKVEAEMNEEPDL